MLTSDEQTTDLAADLAELIVDEVSEADQDWRAIELHAREFVALVARRAAGQVVLAPEGPRSDRQRA
jgi:hypothetical protein